MFNPRANPVAHDVGYQLALALPPPLRLFPKDAKVLLINDRDHVIFALSYGFRLGYVSLRLIYGHIWMPHQVIDQSSPVKRCQFLHRFGGFYQLVWPVISKLGKAAALLKTKLVRFDQHLDLVRERKEAEKFSNDLATYPHDLGYPSRGAIFGQAKKVVQRSSRLHKVLRPGPLQVGEADRQSLIPCHA